MARVLDLQQVFELVKHGFYQCSSPQDDFFVQQEQAIGHVALEMGHQADLVGLQEFARQPVRQVAFVAKQASPQPCCELGCGARSSTLPGVSWQANSSPW